MINNNVVVYEPATQTHKSIQKTVDAEGYTTFLAFTEEQFLQFLTEHNPWLVIVSAYAPGVIALQPVREKVPNKKALVITLTASVISPRGFPEASDIYLTKPFDPRELTTFIRRLRWGWEQNEQAETQDTGSAQDREMPNNTVVVYEEDTAVRQTVQTALEAEGYTVVVVSGVANLLALVAEHTPWLLVLSEDATGLSSSESVRGKLPNPNVAIVALEGQYLGRYEGFHAMPFGADMALRKPFNPQDLKQFVQRLRTGWKQSHSLSL